MSNQSNVVLPKWMWEVAKDEKQLTELALDYMNKRYPGYRVVKIEDGFAICDTGRN